MGRKLCTTCQEKQAVRPGGYCNRCYSATLKGDLVNVTNIPLDKIKIDGGTQSRVEISQETIDRYAEDIEAGDPLPPIDLIFDGVVYWLGDGFHRYFAHIKLGRDVIAARVQEGTRRDAVLHAAKANSTNGLPRKDADKRRAVQMLLAEFPDWPTDKIREAVRVSWDLADSVRKDLEKGKAPTTRMDTLGRAQPTRKISRTRDEQPEQEEEYEPTRNESNRREPMRDVPDREREPGDEDGETFPIGNVEAAETADVPDRERLLDGLGVVIPDGGDAPFLALPRFAEAKALFRKLAATLDSLAKGRGGERFQKQLKCTGKIGEERFVSTDLRNALAALEFAEPYSCVCPYCLHDKTPPKKCRVCHGSGYVTAAEFESAPPEYQAAVKLMVK